MEYGLPYLTNKQLIEVTLKRHFYPEQADEADAELMRRLRVEMKNLVEVIKCNKYQARQQ